MIGVKRSLPCKGGATLAVAEQVFLTRLPRPRNAQEMQGLRLTAFRSQRSEFNPFSTLHLLTLNLIPI